MANSILPGKPTDPRQVDGWLHIDDFTPGIWDNSYISNADGVFPAPLGAADSVGTFCCASLGGGGLGPLPALTQTYVYTEGFPGALTSWNIVGFIVNPGLGNVDTEAIIILEGDDGTTHYVLAYSYVIETGGANVILTSNSPTTGGFFGAPYPVWTRMTADGTGNPSPELAFPTAVSTDANGNNGHLYIYPPIAAPTTFAVQDLITVGSSTTGQTIAYGNRILALTGLNYPWPAGGGIGTNENINFTDPPQSAIYGNQKTILATEDPWGYGAWGTISVGELLLVKKYGGGVILNGDIFNPSSVIPIPGIESTGDFVGQADSTPIGLIYCSENRGAWNWNGGNNSTKISAQLRDNFFDTGGVPNSNNYGFNVSAWQDWVLFSNNYLYNPGTGGWWRIYPPTGGGNASVTGHTLWWWVGGRFGYQMYAAPNFFGPLGNWFYKFDSRTSAPHYQWISQPVDVSPGAGRLLDVVQVVLKVSDPTGSGTATVSVTVGGFNATTDDTITVNPVTLRLNAGSGSVGLYEIIAQINGDNASGAAPIIHSIDIGFKSRALPGSDN